MSKAIIAAVLCVLLAVSAVQVEGRRPRRREGGMDDDMKAMFEGLKTTFETCKDQVETWCPPPVRPEGEEGEERRLDDHDDGEGDHRRGPNPFHIALCLHDHEGDLTGECATAWGGVEADVKTTVTEAALDRLTPMAQFVRACRPTVVASCDVDGQREDVMACLDELENNSQLPEECAEAKEDAEEAREHHMERHGDHDDHNAVQASGDGAISYTQFQALDDMEMEPEEDNKERRPRWMGFVIGGVAVAAVVAAVVGAVVFYRRRRARARATLPEFEMHEGKMVQRVNSMDSDDSQAVMVKARATPPSDTKTTGVEYV